MILVLGSSGYVGQAFVDALRERGSHFRPVSRSEVDYSRFDQLLRLLEESGAEFLVNAAGFTGKPNVDACEREQSDTLRGNVLLPQTIAHACASAGIPWGHVSSGCIFAGARVTRDGVESLEPELMKPGIREHVLARPESVRGFHESDVPNFSFRHPPCSFYSGTKALAEECLAEFGNAYLWRLRIPFDEVNSPRNYLAKLQKYPRVFDNFNSISHRGEFARACLELWEGKAAPGVYNMTNPGFVSSRQVVGLIQQILKPNRAFEFWESGEAFYREGKVAPRSNCVLDGGKLAAAGVRMRPVWEAVEDSLKNWRTAS